MKIETNQLLLNSNFKNLPYNHRHLTLYIFLIVEIDALYLVVHRVPIPAILDLFRAVASAGGFA